MPDLLAHSAQEALWIAVMVSLPVLGAAALAGAVIAALQAASQLQDQTLAHFPRFLVIAAVLVLMGPWMAHTIALFAERMFSTAVH